MGPTEFSPAPKPGSLIIDMSSISPLVSQKIAAACAAKGVDFLDAPVSGGEPKAIDGTLAIMVGGSEAAFAKAEPILKCMGSSVTLTGPVGAGNTTKLANQIMVACNIAAMGEALTLATRCGLNPEVVVNAVKAGLAGSAVLNAKGPMLIARNFKPGFKIKLHQKDLRNALKTAEANHVCLPLTAQVQQMLSSLIADGKGDSITPPSPPSLRRPRKSKSKSRAPSTADPTRITRVPHPQPPLLSLGWDAHPIPQQKTTFRVSTSLGPLTPASRFPVPGPLFSVLPNPPARVSIRSTSPFSSFRLHFPATRSLRHSPPS